MKHKDHLHCPICGARFDTQVELDLHERARHTQQGVSGVIPSNEYPPPDEQTPPRKDNEFTRRNPE
jgi:hypothetical protein